jgi:hypothetical protein
MAQFHVMMSRLPQSNLARDRVVTTFHIDTDLDFLIDDGEQAEGFAQDAATLFADTMGALGGFTGWEARVYTHGAPKLTPPIATATAQPGGTPLDPGPREVALCLSYYATLNQPRRRGRMYLGPWPASQMAERPGTTPTGACGTIAQGLAALGGPTTQWVQYSPTTGEFHNVTNFFIDNEWDTQRSRGLRATSRAAAAIEG